MFGGINNVVRIPTTKDNFFKYWFEFLRPFHNLTNREIEIVSLFVKYRFELSKSISDETLLNRVLMSEDTKRLIREECGIKSSHFQVIMYKLRDKGIIQGDSINQKFIPNISIDDKDFKLMLLFDFKDKDEGHGKKV